MPSEFDSMSTVAAVLPSCHCGSVGSFTKAAEMMPVDFSGPAGRVAQPDRARHVVKDESASSFSRAGEHGTKSRGMRGQCQPSRHDWQNHAGCLYYDTHEQDVGVAD